MSDKEIKPWYSEKIFRLRGVFRSEPPICVSAAFLRSNPKWIFHTMFDAEGRYPEPPNETYTYPTGLSVKVYPLDIPDEGLDIIFGLMWQFDSGYVTDYTLIERTYLNAPQKLRSAITLIGWVKLLRYYGFLNPSIPMPALEYVEPPVLERLRECAKILVDDIFVHHPEWEKFTRGHFNDIFYQFAWRDDDSDVNDGITMYMSYDGGRGMEAVGLLLRGQGDQEVHGDFLIQYIMDYLRSQYPIFTACCLETDTPSKEGDDIQVEHWPLTNVLSAPSSSKYSVTPITTFQRHTGTYLAEGYKGVTLTLWWECGHKNLVLPLL